MVRDELDDSEMSKIAKEYKTRVPRISESLAKDRTLVFFFFIIRVKEGYIFLGPLEFKGCERERTTSSLCPRLFACVSRR